MIRTSMIEVSVMLAIDEYLKRFACHSKSNFEMLTSLEGKCSRSLLVFFVESVFNNSNFESQLLEVNFLLSMLSTYLESIRCPVLTTNFSPNFTFNLIIICVDSLVYKSIANSPSRQPEAIPHTTNVVPGSKKKN